MASIGRALARIKDDVRAFVPDESIREACRAAGHRWRERRLGPVETVHLFVLQVIHFNTAIRHLRHLAGHAVNAAAYCEARMRLPLDVLRALLRGSAAATGAGADRWCGLRVLLVDGSSTIAPDTPASQRAFGQPPNQKPGCGFPVPKIMALFDAFSGMVLEALCLPLFTHEQSGVWRLHPMLGPGDVLVGDRGFCSYVHLAMLHLRGVAGLFRVHQRQIVDFRPGRKPRRKGQRGRPRSRVVRRLGKHDQVVAWPKPGRRPEWMAMLAAQFDALPAELHVRELRYHLKGRGRRTRVVTVATTLLDPGLYPKEKVAQLYGLRWSVETHFGELKTTLRMRRVKSQTPDGVRKELAVYCLVYNLVRAVMLRAAERQGTTPDRVSFIDALRWLLSAATAGQDVAALVINPRREGRHEPRVVKDLQDTYRKMTLPRPQMRRRLELAKR
jgi:DDE family transposase